MSRNGAGTYTLPAGNPVVSGTTISASWANTTLFDIGSELTNSIDKSGRTVPMANLPMGGFKLTGLGAASATGDSIPYQQALNQDAANVASGTTTDIAAVLATNINITGVVTPVASLGTGAAAGVKKFIKVVTGPITFTNSATLICQGGGDLTLLTNDAAIVTSEGVNVWRISQVSRASAVTARLSDIGAAITANTLANAAYQQTWGWVFTTNPQYGLYLTGIGSGGVNGTILTIDGAPSVGNGPATLLDVRGSPTGFGGSSMSLLRVGSQSITIAGWNAYAANLPGAVSITAGDAVSQAGGNVIIASGTSTGDDGGNIAITAGNGDVGGGDSGGSITLTPGSGTTHGSVVLSANGGANVVTVNNVATTLGGTGKVVFDAQRVVFDNTNGAPTVTAGGGAGVAIAGADHAFEIIMGTGSPTSVTVTFADARPATPQIVLCSTSQAGCRLNYTATTTTVQISTDLAWASGAKLSVMVFELQ